MFYYMTTSNSTTENKDGIMTTFIFQMIAGDNLHINFVQFAHLHLRICPVAVLVIVLHSFLINDKSVWLV